MFAAGFQRNVLNVFNTAVSGDGAAVHELRRWRANFVGNYEFQGEKLKGFGLGTGVRWPGAGLMRTWLRPNTGALAANRARLFAEAVVAFKGGERWWPDGAFEARHIKPEQDARYESDVWEQAIIEWMEREKKYSATVLEVAHEAVFLETPRIGTADQRRIAAALERLGWRRGERTMRGRPWVRGA